MKLHLNTVEQKSGLIFKTPIWLMDVRIELSEAEAGVLQSHREIGKMVIAEVDMSFDPNVPILDKFTVNQLVNGITGHRLKSIQQQTAFETSVREGCKALKGHLGRHLEVGGSTGPTVEEI